MLRKRYLVKAKKFLPFFRSNGELLLIVIIVSGLLLAMNFYTIRILSSVRAYIHGESFYSKGQKDAARHLAMYIGTQDETYWEAYKKDIEIPISDRKARIALLNRDIEKAKEALFKAHIHPDDMEGQIWLFLTFKDLPLMKEPIQIWTEADSIIEEQDKLAHQIHERIRQASKFDSIEKDSLLNVVYHRSAEITEKEVLFLQSMGDTSRGVGKLIGIANAVLTIMIIGGASAFAMRVVNKLVKSEDKLMLKNKELQSINAELDRFVYSASHDLRAPITSMQGLIKIAKAEQCPQERGKYFKYMNDSLKKQDDFIKKIIVFSKNKRIESSFKEVDLSEILDQIFAQLQYMDNHNTIKLVKNLHKAQLNVDPFRIEIILTNLFSNAIKFLDPRKDEQIIEVTTAQEEGLLCLSVKDNGLGIPEKFLNKIFDMFFMTTYNEEGSGVGLYIVRETIEKMGGAISVTSKVDVGTTFRIVLPQREGAKVKNL